MMTVALLALAGVVLFFIGGQLGSILGVILVGVAIVIGIYGSLG